MDATEDAPNRGWWWCKDGKQLGPKEFSRVRCGEEIACKRKLAAERYEEEDKGHYNHLRATKNLYKIGMECIWSCSTGKERRHALNMFTWALLTSERVAEYEEDHTSVLTCMRGLRRK